MSNNFKIDIHNLRNFSEKERQKFSFAMVKLESVLNSGEFEYAVMEHEFDQANGMSNKELYDYFMSGRTKFNNVSDQDIDLDLTLYYSFRNTVGYTYPSTWKTWTNRKFFSKFNYGEIGGHVVHEDRHNAGFDHKRASDHDSVPYAFGFIVRDLINGKWPPRRYAKKRKYKKRWWQFWL